MTPARPCCSADALNATRPPLQKPVTKMLRASLAPRRCPTAVARSACICALVFLTLCGWYSQSGGPRPTPAPRPDRGEEEAGPPAGGGRAAGRGGGPAPPPRPPGHGPAADQLGGKGGGRGRRGVAPGRHILPAFRARRRSR